ncbi:MAG: alpha/beta hydrolase [Deltaproteobacteria bacterium]|nr:alpha/beta hydrolase [Deltaproteobacteria bacterium]
MPIARNKNVEIYFESHGQGTPFLFFCETACAGDIWNHFQVPEFSRDHLVITHDYRGTGKSSRPTMQFSSDDLVDDAIAILDELNAGPAIVLGHSFGGRLALLMALKYPQRVKKIIAASVGAGNYSAPGLPIKMCKEMVQWGYEKYVREHTLEVGWPPEYIKQNPERVERFLNVRMNNLPSLEDYLRHVIARQDCDISARLHEIKHPTLVLVGDLDHSSASGNSQRVQSEIMTKAIPDAQYAVIPNEAHNYFMTNPDEAHRIIRRFLSS